MCSPNTSSLALFISSTSISQVSLVVTCTEATPIITAQHGATKVCNIKPVEKGGSVMLLPADTDMTLTRCYL